jgi:hypothetical protein
MLEIDTLFLHYRSVDCAIAVETKFLRERCCERRLYFIYPLPVFVNHIAGIMEYDMNGTFAERALFRSWV